MGLEKYLNSNEFIDRKLQKEALERFKSLELDPENLKGKVFLDMGAGDGYLAEYLRKTGVTDKAYSVDKNFKFREGKNVRIADVRMTLYPNEFFDVVVSTRSFLTMERTNEDPHEFTRNVHMFIKEILRILKKNGEARIAPVSVWSSNPIINRNARKLKSMLEDLKNDGLLEFYFTNCEEIDWDKYRNPPFWVEPEKESSCTLIIKK